MKEGQEVLIVDYPGRYAWMKDLVGKQAEIVEVHTLYRIKMKGSANKLWIGEAYVKELEK